MKNLRNLILLSTLISYSISPANTKNICLNAALNKPATAGSSTITEIPSRAVDGDLTTNWCAKGYTGWIKIDLQDKFSVDSIILYVNQAVAGNTVHEVQTSEDMTNWTLVKTLSGSTSNNQIITLKFTPALSNVRGVMINTTASTSWVAWYEIEVYSTPTKPTITQTDNVLMSSSAIKNQWYLNGNPIPNANTQSYTMTTSGVYQVGVTNGSGCETMSETADITTGLYEIEKSDITISPNPSKDNITVEGATKGKIEIVNLQGQLIKSVNVSDNKTNIDISDLSSGVYSLMFTSNKGIIVKKLLKQ